MARAKLPPSNLMAMKVCFSAATAGVQPYKYGAKELDRENGLDFYDSHARFYDSMIGRTTSQDPIAEKYYHLSPYLWCAANPIKFGDKNGMYLKGIDGNPVFFDKKRGWTSNATPSIAKIGGAMMRTKQGKKILSRMMKTDIQSPCLSTGLLLVIEWAKLPQERLIQITHLMTTQRLKILKRFWLFNIGYNWYCSST